MGGRADETFLEQAVESLEQSEIQFVLGFVRSSVHPAPSTVPARLTGSST